MLLLVVILTRVGGGVNKMKLMIKLVLTSIMVLSFSATAFASTAVSDAALTKGGQHVAECAQMMTGVSECAKMYVCEM